MAGDARTTTTIEELIASGAIVAHKDGNYGSNYPRVEEFGSEGVPFLTAKSLRDGYVDVAGAPRLPDERADELRFGFVETDDVLLSHNATIGRVAVVPPHKGRLLVGTSLTYFRLNPQKLLPRYLAVYLAGADFQNQLVAVMSHSTRNQVPVTAQRKLNVVVPPLAEQKAIAAVLGAPDDKFELNRRMSATLESIARALFQSWFVDSNPAERPKDWREVSLDSIATFLNGLALQKFPPAADDSLPVIKIAQLRKGATDGADRASSKLPPEYIIEDGDVLFSWSGSLEVELWCGGRGALNQHLFKVTSSKFPKWFYFLWTRHHLPDFRATAAGKATTMGHIQRHHLTEAKVLIPTAAEMEKMDRIMSPVINKLIANKLESRTLATVRDTLLPKLL